MRQLRKLAAILMVIVTIPVGAAVWWKATFGQSTPEQPRPTTTSAGNNTPKLVRITPGTVVNDQVPEGWSCRIIKTVLKLKSGDVDSLPQFAFEAATRLKTVVLAEVGPGPSGYTLRRLGVGLAMKHQGSDIVVSSDSAARLGVELSSLDRLVLSRAEKALDRGRMVARTPTFMVYDASVESLQEGGHRSVFLRYALMVNPRIGQIHTLVWPVAEDPLNRSAPETMVLLPPNALFHCGIHVQATRLPGGLPVAWYFAMDGLPPGERLPLTPELRKWSILDPKTGPQAIRFEAATREALKQALGKP